MRNLSDILAKQQSEIEKEWLREMSASLRRADLISDEEFTQQSRELLRLIAGAAQNGNLSDMGSGEWTEVREYVSSLSAARARQGFSPSETAMFILSLKQPLFARIRSEFKDPQAQFTEVWNATTVLDRIALMSTDASIAVKEQMIVRQQEEMMELSTPVVKLWEGILALPVIGTLDSARTQVVMESLLQTIVETNSRVAIIDITGVPTVDTLVAQHLLKTITAARLMGADCIVSGVRPQIAQTIVHLGINLTDVITKATLADAFALALEKSGRTVTRVQKAVAPPREA